MKTIKKSNFRIEVYPQTTLYGFKVNEEEYVCNEMLKDIIRHANGVLSANLAYDSDPVCSSCGSHWTEDSYLYNGGCCKADQDAKHDPTRNI